MQTMPAVVSEDVATILDVRLIAPSERHRLVFQLFERLGAGASFELQSDHEPLALQHQFQSLWTGQFDWELLEAGPKQWRVRIGRLASASSCCGCCGGAR
jgi:uncharacterized protein (DUF2249 family)